ncbi:tmv resistance protein n [Nicotiana attenuata]|uniref:Tmv resistance protein n n=1 Tax=Nicotiana attenuata TaxID=49451 RepID=A0A1J6JBB9_NICAT|nr:tmv resistance protein n [Nicotiana attenuata]
MASSSSAGGSSKRPQWNYDVFLSFRGEDTRKTFTSHLYEGLHRMGIITFQDDKRLEHGTSISEELSKAIEESQFAVIIFSRNYASSGWCLDEVVKIMECKNEYGQTVIPVFYDVDPSQVRNQRENFAEAFDKHESKYKDDVEGMQKVQRWRSALTAAANLKGHDIRDGGPRQLKQSGLMSIRALHNSKALAEALKNMKRLRLLCINYVWGRTDCYNGSIEYLSNNLRSLFWNRYPWESLPVNFEPTRLVDLQLSCSSLCQLWTEKKDLSNLEEVHHSLRFSRKLVWLDLGWCQRLERFSYVDVGSLEYLGLLHCSSLEKFPEILGRIKVELKIDMRYSGIRELPSSVIQYQTHITKLDLSCLKDLVTLSSSIFMLKSLKFLSVLGCKILESLPEEIGGLELLEKLDAQYTLISRPPSSIVYLNKLKSLSFAKEKSEEGAENEVHFVFPPVAEGLRSLEILNLSYCNLIVGQFLENIGCLSSLAELYLTGNNFEHLPQSLAQLAALRLLDLADCKKLKELPELPPNIGSTLRADYHVALKSMQNLATKYLLLQLVVFTSEYDVESDELDDLLAETLLQCMSSLQHAFSASDSLSERMFTLVHPGTKIPIWFHRNRTLVTSVLVKLPENWYANDNFLRIAICYLGSAYDKTFQLIPLTNEDKSEQMIKKLECIQYICRGSKGIHFLFIPFISLWDASKANGKTPNKYGHLKVSTSRFMKEFGFRLLYKDEPEVRLGPCYRREKVMINQQNIAVG